MPRAKERRGRNGASKELPREKKLSSRADIKPMSNGSQRKSKGQVGKPPKAAQSSSAVSANWKKLAKQLGLDSSHGRREKRADGDKSKIVSSKNTSKFISSGKRKKMTEEPPQPKRRRLDDDGGVGKMAGEVSEQPQRGTAESKLITGRDTSAGRCVSLDCEMVGTGPTGDFSMLARCSIVNHHGNVLYDSYVAPMDKITDYRTKFSGITPQHLRGASEFKSVQKEVSELIKGRVLIGHAIHHDLKALLLSHPRRDIRDTTKFKHFRQLSRGKAPSLKKLAKEILSLDIQQDHHNSVEDARVAMRLYQLHKREWEAVIKAKRRAARGHGH